MKPRQPNEPADRYIARLEAANTDLRRNNKRLADFQNYACDVLAVAASHCGLLIDYAADLCGEAGGDEHKAIKRELDALCGLHWRHPPVNLPKKIDWQVKVPDAPSDAGMILRSALEKVKCHRAPWDAERLKAFPDRPDFNAIDMIEVQHIVWDALSDLDAGRTMLRDDLRSAIYDYAFKRISAAVSRGADIQALRGGEPARFGDDEDIPFAPEVRA